MIKSYLIGVSFFAALIFLVSRGYESDKQDKMIKQNKVSCESIGIVDDSSCFKAGFSIHCRVSFVDGKKMNIEKNVVKGDNIYFCKNSVEHYSLPNYFRLNDN